LTFRVVSIFGFRVSSFGFRVSGFGFRVAIFGLRFWGFGFQGLGLSTCCHACVDRSNLQRSECPIWFRVLGFRGWGLGFRVSSLGLRVSKFWFKG
jgi:hypothetical protein